ncbi:unnamed protein product [Adineta ricciae]|uniref:Uncharacterized protein n=2 Tax=Adineta ricciae TaxID=249248 RepID=A0A815IVC2_ADIRI|nr:unnamed protein product [Adineta ricciae]
MYVPMSPPPVLTSNTTNNSTSLNVGDNPSSQSIFDRHSAAAKRYKYLRRLLKFRQMDFEFAIWQIIHLFIAPQKVFRAFQYRKQTKNQWARDDPAFLVLLMVFLVVSSIIIGLVLGMGFFGIIKLVLWVVLVDCVLVGLLISTIYWYIANRYLIANPKSNLDVEWAYCFDVHLNAVLPLLTILHIGQLPFLNSFAVNTGFFYCLFGNTVWAIATGYYVYILFLGFSALPFLRNVHVLLYPLTGLLLVYILSILVQWNFTQMIVTFYEYRVENNVTWSYGVAVSTLDFESSDPSSNLDYRAVFLQHETQLIMWRLANSVYRAFRNTATHRCSQDAIVSITTIYNTDDDSNTKNEQECLLERKHDIHQILANNQFSYKNIEKLQDQLKNISLQKVPIQKIDVVKVVEAPKLEPIINQDESDLKSEQTLDSLLKTDETCMKTIKELNTLHEETMSMINLEIALDALESGNVQLGFEALQASAKNGINAAALYNLGICYEQGIGVKQDRAKACDYYCWAADLGHMNAQYSLTRLSNRIDLSDSKENTSSEISSKNSATPKRKTRFRLSLLDNYLDDQSFHNDHPYESKDLTVACLL